MSYSKKWNNKWPLYGLFFIVAIFGFTAIVMLLWNAILPDVLSVSPITYWQAMGILVLSKILFGGFGKGKGHHRRKSFSNADFRQKFSELSEEERAVFKEKWKNKCQRD